MEKVPAKKRSDRYFKFNQEDWSKVPKDMEQELFGFSFRDVPPLSKTTYSCKVYKINEDKDHGPRS